MNTDILILTKKNGYIDPASLSDKKLMLKHICKALNYLKPSTLAWSDGILFNNYSMMLIKEAPSKFIVLCITDPERGLIKYSSATIDALNSNYYNSDVSDEKLKQKIKSFVVKRIKEQKLFSKEIADVSCINVSYLIIDEEEYDENFLF